MSEFSIEFEQLKAQAVEGAPVEVFCVGATISQSEKRFIKQYSGNDYFSSLTTKFSRPISTNDAKALSSMTRQLLMLSTLQSMNIRKEQVRDGISPEIGPDIAKEFSVSGSSIIEGAIKPGKEVEALKAQIKALRMLTDSSIQPDTPPVEEPIPEPAPTAVPAKTTTRKKVTQPAIEEVG